MTRSLLVLADRLAELGVTRVVMEATSDYWKSPFYLLEARGFEVWLVNAKDVKHLPGRPKTDRLDAVWLCKVADLVGGRTAEKQRVEKLLEDAQIKLSVVASDSFGASGRAMLDALVAGERDPKVLAQLARTRLRTKRALLQEAFVGRFGEHHAFLLSRMLSRIDQAAPTLLRWRSAPGCSRTAIVRVRRALSSRSCESRVSSPVCRWQDRLSMSSVTPAVPCGR
jgi:transposase